MQIAGITSSGYRIIGHIVQNSKAEGKYKNRDGKNLQLDILDTGGMGMMSAAPWTMATIDKKTKTATNAAARWAAIKVLKISAKTARIANWR